MFQFDENNKTVVIWEQKVNDTNGTFHDISITPNYELNTTFWDSEFSIQNIGDSNDERFTLFIKILNLPIGGKFSYIHNSNIEFNGGKI
jgi:hypothetical protein